MHGTLPIIQLDCSQLAVLAAAIKVAHAEYLATTQRALEHAITAGERLLEAKLLLKHGEWLPWRRNHVGIPERTCQHYMRLARRAGELSKSKSATVADLTVRAALKVLENKSPSDNIARLPNTSQPYGACWALSILIQPHARK
jgi:hypothetical protein